MLAGITSCDSGPSEPEPVAPAAIGSIPAQTMVVGDVVTLDVTSFFRDPDEGVLTYTASSSNSGVVTATMSGSNLTLTAVAAGTATVTVTATDPDDLTATQSTGVTVDAANQRPEAVGTIPAQTMVAGEVVTLDVTSFFRDPDEGTLTYTASSSDNGVVTATMSGSNLTLTAVAAGTATVTVTATDPDGLTATQSTGVTVEAANHGPETVGTIPAQTMVAGDEVTLDMTSFFRDPDGDVLAYTASSSNSGVVTTTLSGSNLTMTAVAAGTATVTVAATDPDGLTATQSARVTVDAANQGPEAVGTIPARTMMVDDVVTLDVTSFFRDPDGDVLAYTASSSNSGVVTATMSGSNLTMTAVAAGTVTVTVTATDPDGLTGTQSTGVMVDAANQGPEAVGTIPAQMMVAGNKEMLDVTSFFRDPDGDVLTYTASSSNSGVVRVTISGSNLTVTAVAAGTATVTVTASDPGGLTATQSAGVTVEAANQAPEAVGTIPSQTVVAGNEVSLNVISFFRDPDGDVLTYTASSSNSGVATVTTFGSILTVTGVAVGTSTVTVTVTDPGGLTAKQSMGVTVEAANQAPEAVGTIPAQTMVVGDEVTLDVTTYFRDPDGDALTYAASSSDNGVVTATMPGSNMKVTAVTEGSATVTVTATDPGGLRAAQSARVTVDAANQGPEAVGMIPARTMMVDDVVTLNVTSFFRDPDGDVLTYTASSSNSGVVTATMSGSNLTMTAVAAGTVTVTVTATDPDGLTATQSTGVRVTGPVANRAPEAVGTIPAQTIVVGFTVTLNMTAFFRDPDEDALTYTASSSRSNVARVSVAGSTVRITAESAGNATITITARDPGDLSATQRVSVQVASPSAPDLEFTSVTPTSVTISPGNSVTADFTLRNSGGAPAPPTTIRLYISSDASISTSDTETSSTLGPSLAVGAGVIFTPTITSNSLDDYWFGLCADAVSGESNTQNNCSQGVHVEIVSTGSPDLVVNLSESAVTIAPGNSFSYDITVRNQGDGASAATEIRAYYSTDPTITTSDQSISDPAGVPPLGPSQEGSATGEHTVGAGTPEGTDYIGVCVDAVPGESDTGNNCSSAITVTITSGGGSTDYTVAQTVTTLPTGYFVPSQLGSNATFVFSDGKMTITFSGTSTYMIHNNSRYSCLTSSGCEIVDRVITQGTIREQAQSADRLKSDRQILHSVNTVMFKKPDGNRPVPSVTSVSIRVQPHGND